MPSNESTRGVAFVEFAIIALLLITLTLGLINFCIVLGSKVLLNRAAEAGMSIAVPDAMLSVDTHMQGSRNSIVRSFESSRGAVLDAAEGFIAGTFLRGRLEAFSISETWGATNVVTTYHSVFLRPGDQWTNVSSNATLTHPTRALPPNGSTRYRDETILGSHPYYLELQARIDLWPLGSLVVSGSSARYAELPPSDRPMTEPWPTFATHTSTVGPSVTPPRTNTPTVSPSTTPGGNPTATATATPIPSPTPVPTCNANYNSNTMQPQGCCRTTVPCPECLDYMGCCLNGACGG